MGFRYRVQAWHPEGGRRRPRARRLLRHAIFLSVFWMLASLAPGHAGELRFVTDNDFLTSNPTDDDLYTFSVALEIDRGGYTFGLREVAFTDRQAHLRFDETYLSVGRPLPLPGAWRAYGEAGLVRVGRGLLGQDAQNALHRLIGDDEVHLTYISRSHIHPTVRLELHRSWAFTRNLTAGPYVEASTAPGFQSHAIAGIRTHWRPHPVARLQVLAGARFSHTAFDPLEPHVAGAAPVVEVGLTLHQRIVLSWSYNEYGTERQHLSLGYRIGPAGRDVPGGGG